MKQSHSQTSTEASPASPWPALAHRETLSRKMVQNQTQSSTKVTTAWEKPLSVLAFGDSLTVGMISNSSSHRPYGQRLATLLGVPAESVTTAGFAGEKTGGMAQRLQHELRLSARTPFTHVVILGGTNDLREGLPPETVLRHLIGLYNIVRASGAKCVAVTIPRFGPRDAILVPMTRQRFLVNSVLRAMAAPPGQGKEPLVQLADLDQAIECLSATERNSLFSDSIHFSARGYGLLADLACAAVKGIAASTAASHPAPVSTGLHMTNVLMSSRSMVAPVTVRMPLAPSGSTVRFKQVPTSSALVGRSLGTWAQPPVRSRVNDQKCHPVVGTSVHSPVRCGTSFYFSPRKGLTSP